VLVKFRLITSFDWAISERKPNQTLWKVKF